MYSVKVNGEAIRVSEFTLNNGKFEAKLDGQALFGDYIKINERQFHFIINHQSYNVDLLKINKEDKTLSIRINTNRFELSIKDKYDELLHHLGLDELASKKINDVKAPMPGMVLNILVKEGDIVKKGDAILVLEAMKMENILKSPTDGLIKKISAVKGAAVEKNQVLIHF